MYLKLRFVYHSLSDLPTQFLGEDSRPAKLNDRSIGSLFWADDIVMISEAKEGLQHSLDRYQEYCESNKIKVNVGKTKCIIFNKGGQSVSKGSIVFQRVWACFRPAFNADNPIEKLSVDLCTDLLGVKPHTFWVQGTCHQEEYRFLEYQYIA